MAKVADAIKAAQAEAENIVDQEQENLPTPAPAANVPAMPAKKPSMEQAAQSAGISSRVDMFLKVNEHGLTLGDKKGLTDKIKVRMLMVEDDGYTLKQSIKWGSPVNYASTYDWVNADSGLPWADQVAQVQRMDPRAKPFNSADLVFELIEDVKLKDETVPAGTVLGHSLSMSNWGNWAAAYQEASKAGFIGKDAEFVLEAEEVNGKNSFTWGVIKFHLVK